MRIEFQKEKDLSTKMVSSKRNWISKSNRMGSRHPVLLYIHSLPNHHTLTIRAHIFSFYIVPNRFHTFTQAAYRYFLNFNTVVVVPKALFLKWNFMSVIVAFHSITGWQRAIEKKKKKTHFEASNYEAFFLSFCFLKKFHEKKTCRDFASFLLSSSRSSLLINSPSWP